MAGIIKRSTANYNLGIPYFDMPTWGSAIERDLDIIDALLSLTGIINGVRGDWQNNTVYEVGDRVVDTSDNTVWICNVNHTSANTGTFAQDRATNPTYWNVVEVGVVVRGEWLPNTDYYVNDFVFSSTDHIYGMVNANHTSTTSMRADILKFDVIADLGTDFENSMVLGMGNAPHKAVPDVGDKFGYIQISDTTSVHVTFGDLTTALVTASVTPVITGGGPTINALTDKPVPINADELYAADSEDAFAAIKISIDNLRKLLVRYDAVQALSLAEQGQARGNIGVDITSGYRNKIINGDFDIWQRGTSQTTVSGIGSDDRWDNVHTGSTKVHSRQTFALGQTDVPGNPTYFSRTVVTSVAGANNLCAKLQRMESVKTLQGETATLTFYAKADAPKNIAIEIVQNFGSGGSPSSDVATPFGLVALTTSWKRYDVLINVPSIAGKTLGSNNDGALLTMFWFDAGSNYNARTTNLGQQSGTFDISHVSFVRGDARKEADPFPQMSLQQTFSECQRFLQIISIPNFYMNSVVANAVYVPHIFATPMRTTPVFTTLATPQGFSSAGSSITLATFQGNVIGPQSFFVSATPVTGTMAGYGSGGVILASAELF